MSKPTYVRMQDKRGSFSVPAQRRAALEKAGCTPLPKEKAADANGNPLPFEPAKPAKSTDSSVAAPTAAPASSEASNK